MADFARNFDEIPEIRATDPERIGRLLAGRRNDARCWAPTAG